MRGLIIKQPYVGRILEGKKTWELRSGRANIRERIGLIEAGTSTVVGECDLVDCIPVQVSPAGLKETQAFHGLLENEYYLTKKYRWAWVLENVARYDEPIRYAHTPGAQMWVRL